MERSDNMGQFLPRLSLGQSLSKHQQAMFGDKSVIFLLETKQDIRCPRVLKDQPMSKRFLEISAVSTFEEDICYMF